jgi:flagellum-specific ATP synthase
MTEAALSAFAAYQPYPAEGRVLRIHAGEIEADGPDLSVGMLCAVHPSVDRGEPVQALVAAVSSEAIILVPFSSVASLKVGDSVRAEDDNSGLPVGDGFAGRAISALGRPLDGGAEIKGVKSAASPFSTLDRIAPSEVIATGVRAIDGLLTLGRGQRMGIFAASGVGKTRLIGQIIEQASCDRLVICQVGERGREVGELWSNLSSSAARPKVTLVAATSDESAPMRARAVDQALALAEYWRSRGEHVLLIVDSITRLAMALREIGLIAGEPPTARAYTPNVFRELPRIVERCGAARSGGSITALFTVLSETDDADDPLVEIMKSLLDGHILLSRNLAQAGHFPAIDVPRSISRMFDALVDDPQLEAARKCRAWLAKAEESRILVESGMYKAGGDKVLDAALAARDGLDAFLRQGSKEQTSIGESRQALMNLVGRHG